MLSIRNLTKSYKTGTGRNYVFRDVSIDFPEDVNIGIIGPNGAGKSTLLRILGGIDHPDSGSINCDRTMSWPLGLRGGFVGNLSGRENCRIVCSLYGMDTRTIRNKLGFIKELSGIGEYFEEPVKYYSTGMGSRVGFALSMAFDFQILLIDELISVGDRNFRQTARNAIDEKRGQSNVIMVSHSMGSMRDFCDIGILLRDGELTVYDDLDEGIRAYLPKEEEKETYDLTTEDTLKVGSHLFTAHEDREATNLREQINGRLQQIEQALRDGDSIHDEGKLFHQLGLAYSRLGDLDQAIKYLHKALQEHPDNPSYHIQMVNAAMQKNRVEEAETVLAEAFKSWPENPWLLNQLGNLKTLQRQTAEAFDAYSKAAEQVPDNAGIRHCLAVTLLSQGKMEDALQHCLKAIEIDDLNPTPFRTLSRILAAQGLYKDSIRALREANEKQQAQSRTLSTENSELKAIRVLLEKATEQIG